LVKKRSASEVLLSLENRVEILEGLVRSIDHNIKLLLNNKNISERKIIKEPINKISKPKVSKDKSASKVVTADAVDFVQVDSGVKNRKRTVRERLTYSDSKAIVLAQVEIFDSSGQLIAKKRTNNEGKWTESLLPGEYSIRVAKGKTSINPPIGVNYEIFVSPDDKPLQLEDRKL